MNNNQLTTRLSIVAVIAASLLAVGIITALSMAEQADAAKKNKTIIINRDSVTANADGADGTSGTSSGADGTDGADGGTAVATIP
jgi:ABC-type Na+ efflux pump permease subunit